MKHRMKDWRFSLEFGVPLWISGFEFPEEVVPLVFDLSLGNWNVDTLFYMMEFIFAKSISPIGCLMEYLLKVAVDGIKWIFTSTESDELRMILVAFCLPFEDVLREERLPPDGKESLGIEILGME